MPGDKPLFDRIKHYLLNKWLIALIVLIAVILGGVAETIEHVSIVKTFLFGVRPPVPPPKPLVVYRDLDVSGSLTARPRPYHAAIPFPVYVDDAPIVTVAKFEQWVKTLRSFDFSKNHGYVKEHDPIVELLNQAPVERGGRMVRLLHCPTGGDADFSGDGPLVTVEVQLQIADDRKKVLALVTMWAAEWKDGYFHSDFTHGIGEDKGDSRLAAEDVEYEIDAIESPTFWGKTFHMVGHGDLQPTFLDGELLRSLTIYGDKKGREMGTRTMAVCQFNTIRVRLKRNG
jgi:hypothetical protein